MKSLKSPATPQHLNLISKTIAAQASIFLTSVKSPAIFRPPMKFIPLMTRKSIEKAILLYLVAHIIVFLIYFVKVLQMMTIL